MPYPRNVDRGDKGVVGELFPDLCSNERQPEGLVSDPAECRPQPELTVSFLQQRG